MSSASGQKWNAQQYAKHARFVSDLGMPVLELLAPLRGERILDLGCGDGALTKKIADVGCTVVGIDASPEMVAAARGLGLNARVVDGHALPFNAEFDAVFSNAALHWLKQPESVIAGVWRALKPGGRYVGEFGGAGNVATIVTALENALRKRGFDPALVNPWYNPSGDEYRSLLVARGFSVNAIDLFPRPTPLPSHIVDWLKTFAQSFAAVLPDAAKPVFFEEVAASCHSALCDDHGQWHADYVRLRFAATKPHTAALGAPDGD